jgi:hypothetical protein
MPINIHVEPSDRVVRRSGPETIAEMVVSDSFARLADAEIQPAQSTLCDEKPSVFMKACFIVQLFKNARFNIFVAASVSEVTTDCHVIVRSEQQHKDCI